MMDEKGILNIFPVPSPDLISGWGQGLPADLLLQNVPRTLDPGPSRSASSSATRDFFSLGVGSSAQNKDRFKSLGYQR